MRVLIVFFCNFTVTTILNPAPAQRDLDDEMFRYTDILCPNETEVTISSFSNKQADEINLHGRKVLTRYDLYFSSVFFSKFDPHTFRQNY